MALPRPLPIVAVSLTPRALAPRIVLAIVGIIAPLGLLPSSAPLALTHRSAAVTLIRDLRTRPKELTAPVALPPPLHARFSVHSNCTAACTATSEDHNVCTTHVDREPSRFVSRELDDIERREMQLPNQISGSISASRGGSIPVSAKGVTKTSLLMGAKSRRGSYAGFA